LLSEVAILCRLARMTLGETPPIPWEAFEADYGEIRDRIGRVVPGLHDYNRRVVRPGGIALPNPVNQGCFPTTIDKALFTRNTGKSPQLPPGHLLLQTLRSHDQWNTVPYTTDDRYRGVRGSRRVVLVNPDDLTELGLTAGDHVDLVSVWTDDVERRAPDFEVVPYRTPRGCAAAYYPETNVLVPLDSVAEFSNQPASKSVVIRLEPHGRNAGRAVQDTAVLDGD
ncbi:MAG: molybdopterin dinucleotide binding domain-containing protein, partial [Stackebrandtia sp.]